MTRTLVPIVLLLSFISGAAVVRANDCDYGLTPCEAYAKADAVFIGQVIRIVPEFIRDWQADEDYDQTAYVAVDKIYKGYKGRRIVLRQLGRRRAERFILGSSYLFYANYDRAAKIWEVRPCGRTRMAKYANDDLHYLDGLPASAGKTRVAGEISRFDPDPDIVGETKRLPGVKVKIRGEGREYEAVTDANGAYELYGLPPGKYTVEPEPPIGLVLFMALHVGPDVRARLKDLDIELKAGGCSGVDIVFTPENSTRAENRPQRRQDLPPAASGLWK